MFADVNYAVVLGAAVFRFALGWVWFSVLFNHHYQDAVKELKRDLQKRKMQNALFLNFVAALVMSFVLCCVTYLAAMVTFQEGAYLGISLCLGFIGTTSIDDPLWHGGSWRMFFIRNAYELFCLAMMGGILARWG